MKNKSKVIALTLVVIFSLAIFSLISLPPAVRATYFEGEITIDTVWTLVDSPFILSGNVTILEGVTLTIEPGVEVRFGGKFSIIVNGRLIAKGTSEFNKLIKFTSNKEEPEPGDWGTIYFNGTGQPPSLLENCIIEYGISGTTIVDGELTIRSSIIRLNSEKGVMALNGSATIEHSNLIYNNTASGIYISGGDVTVSASNVTFNKEGITLTGNLTTSNINITKNIIANNIYGIKLDIEDYNREGLFIEKNRVHSNDYGFYVLTNNTVITRNYIYNNSEAGIFYGQGKHEAHFNDIYNNTRGMEVANAIVDATYNYWGHWNGPYHELLNPHGKGNPVSGDAANVHLIFFLSASIDHENHPPKAVLWTDKVNVAPGQNVTFVGTNSFDEDEYGRIDYYLYNFGDSKNTSWTTSSMFFHSYVLPGEYNASLQVRDDFNSTSEVATTTIKVVDLPILEVSLVLSNYIVDYNSTVSTTIYVTNGTHPTASANVTLFAVAKGFFANFTSSTNSSGYSTLTFAAPNVKDVTDIRIIARASKNGYADGSAYDYLRVLPPLNVALEPDREKLFSDETMSVRVNVTDAYGKPVVDVLVHLFMNGSLISEELTGINGIVIFNFTTPIVYENSTLAIQVEAVKNLYAKGFAICIIKVMPKVLVVHVTADRNVTVSEEEVSVFVHVEYDGVPIPNASVTLSFNFSALPPLTAFTSNYGNATFTFNMTAIPHDMLIAITAAAKKDGYAENYDTLLLMAKPGNLTAFVYAVPYAVKPGESSRVVVYVKCGERPVANANVTVTATIEGFVPITLSTDVSGFCELYIHAPQTAKPLNVSIAVDVAKVGYNSVHLPNCSFFNVVPEAGGIPWLTILFVLIPMLLVVVIVVLVKLGVLRVSFSEEEEGSVS
ncbi:MAG: right-handed parallel beta-helix repeat-containing protein [Candidatus Bathyarchaeia archaeon]